MADDVQLALAEPLSPWVVVSRSRTQVAMLRREAVSNLPPFSAPHVVIAGFRFHAHSHAPLAWPMLSGLRIADLREGRVRSVRVPRGGWLWPIGFSHDDRWFVFASLQPRHLRLYRVERGHTTSQQIGNFDVNAAMAALWKPTTTVSPIGAWLGNSHKLVCKAVVHTRSGRRKRVALHEPLVYDTVRGETARDWIPGSLDTDDDISRFHELCTSQIVIVDITSGKMSRVGTPGVFGLIDSSPDGPYLVVERFITSDRRGTWLSALKRNWELWDLRSGHHIPIRAPRTPSHGALDHGSRRQWEPMTEVWCEEPLQSRPMPRVSRNKRSSGLNIASGNVDQRLVAVMDDAEPSYLVRLESRHSPPFFVIQTGGRSTPLDDHCRTGRPPRAFDKARDIVLTYRDANGASLEARVHVPYNWSRKEPLPCLIWAYPQIAETKGASVQDVARNRYLRPIRFSPLVMLSRGFAVIVHPPMPLKYSRSAKDMVDEMVSVTRALCNAAVSEGVADRGRLVIGGHCRGAFAAALILSRTARTGLFRAGALCAGLYNQLLLPLGGIDRRPTWRAPGAHVALSPMLQAHRIKAPVLIMHGTEDVLFSGFHAVDFSLQSRQFYSAVAASGGTARYVAFPGEGHFFLGRSSVFRASEELIRWCERHTS